MATPEQILELKTKLGLLATKLLFNKYGQDGHINKSQLITLLADADIGNIFTRGAWASGIIAELDKNNDGVLTIQEFLEAAK